jgi:hypothetical protein
MPILHSFVKTEDNHIVTVSQDTDYTLDYVDRNTEKRITSGSIEAGASLTVPTTKDGEWILTLIVGNETVKIPFYVIKYLQNSIITVIKQLLCGDCGCDDNLLDDCISKIAKKALKYKSIHAKLFTYQYTYLSRYTPNFSFNFLQYIDEALKLSTCSIQNKTNNILSEECVTGSTKSVENINKIYLGIFWYGMYLIDLLMAGEDEDEIAFVKTKYKIDTISDCVCSLCIDLDELEAVFDNIIDFNLSFEQVYNENDGLPNEWLGTVIGVSGDVDLGAVSNPLVGLIHIALTGAPADEGFQHVNDEVISMALLKELELKIYPQTVIDEMGLRIVLYNSTNGDTSNPVYVLTGNYGINFLSATQQTAIIPSSHFTNISSFDTIIVTVIEDDVPLNYALLVIDDIKINLIDNDIYEDTMGQVGEPLYNINNLSVNKHGKPNVTTIEVGDTIWGELPLGSGRKVEADVLALPYTDDNNLKIYSVDYAS